MDGLAVWKFEPEQKRRPWRFIALVAIVTVVTSASGLIVFGWLASVPGTSSTASVGSDQGKGGQTGVARFHMRF